MDLNNSNKKAKSSIYLNNEHLFVFVCISAGNLA